MPFQHHHHSLHMEIHQLTATEDSSRQFLLSRNVLKQTLDCSSCSTPMILVPCAPSRSAGLHVWKCRTCKKTRNIRTYSVLAGSKFSLQSFLTLIFYLSVRSLTNVEVAAFTGLSDKAVGEWRNTLANAVADWFLCNCSPLGGPGVLEKLWRLTRPNSERGSSTKELTERECGFL